jgi:hypothetical protein
LGELCADFWWIFSVDLSGIARRDDFDVASADNIVMGSWFSLAIDQLLK